jgi:hypothetical protein
MRLSVASNPGIVQLKTFTLSGEWVVAYFVVILIFSSLLLNEVKDVFLCLLTISISAFITFNLLPIFHWVICPFLIDL